jgi:hypothetical protein
MDYQAHSPGLQQQTEERLPIRRDPLMSRWKPCLERPGAGIAMMMGLAMTTATQRRMSFHQRRFSRVPLLIVMARTRQIVTIRVIIGVDEGVFHGDDDGCVFLLLVRAHVLTHRFFPPFDTNRFAEHT